MSIKHFYIFSTLIILTRILDGITTYLVTPTLEDELNPVIKAFSGNWSLLIVLGMLFTLFILFVFYYAIKRQNLLYKSSPKLTSYFSNVFYNEPNFSWFLLVKMPLFKPAIIFISVYIPILLAFLGIFLVLNNIYILSTYHYDFSYKTYLYIMDIHPTLVALIATYILLQVFYSTLRFYHKTAKSYVA